MSARLSPKPRSSRIEARIRPDVLDTLRRAAEIQGRSLSEFVVSAAEKVARETIEEEQVIRLSAEAQAAFVELLLNPPEPTEGLRRAKAHHERLFGRL